MVFVPKSDKKVTATIPNFTLESAGPLSKLRTPSPVSEGFFSALSETAAEEELRGHVIFVRGDSVPSRLLEESLKRHHFQVTPVQELSQLEALMRGSEGNALLIDHGIPLEKRVQLVSRVHDHRPEMPIILVFPPLTDDQVSRVPSAPEITVVTRDMDGAYLLRIPDKVTQMLRRQKNTEKAALAAPSLSPDETTEQVDLQEVATGLLRGIDASKKASLVVLAGPDVGLVSHVGEDVFLIGRDPTCHLQLKDESISRFHARIYRDEEGRLTVTDLGSTNGTFISGDKIEQRRLEEGDKLLLGQGTLVKFQKQDAIDKNYYDELYYSSTRDGLTGIYNRRYCLEKIKTDLSYARRHSLPVSLLLFDVDHFKQTNDTYGHPTGDVVLTAIAEVTSKVVRTEDVFGRYGGEEFIIFAMDTPFLGAQIFAERIRDKIEKRKVMAVDGTRRIISATVSIGIATTAAKPCYDWEKLMAAADNHLYQAKTKGRNCVVGSELFE